MTKKSLKNNCPFFIVFMIQIDLITGSIVYNKVQNKVYKQYVNHDQYSTLTRLTVIVTIIK
ncbi:hypothetical protein VY86_13325 [Photorhabdus thracensis]|uniref:Uncharacterized protein n=1 Tax=Photorhabdus thracensis TaxID=230089 RepID=A0A0F7LNQ2_9GAMM|nr:hypothetical protein VY86_13325 [Photorhabdus thracensis]